MGSTEGPQRTSEARFRRSKRTVVRYLRRLRRRGDPAKHWLAFLANHREVIAALDSLPFPR